MCILSVYYCLMNDIKCPHCGKIVHVDEVLRNQLEKTILKEESEKQKIELDKVKIAAEKEAQEKFEKEKQKALELSLKEKKLLENQLLKEQKEAKEREEKAKEEGLKEANEKSRLEKLEFEKKIADMQKSMEEAQRKGKQGSQQLQGEVLELDLEEKLKTAFPNDEFVPIPKGVEGADIWQKVKFQGQVVGSIIWETKRTKEWRPIWLPKLKDDAAKVNASEAIIVSQVLPEGSTAFDRKDGIWITTYEHAIGIARYVSFLIRTIAKIKSGATQTDEEWTKIRDYMLSDSFKHRMQAHFDGVKSLREMLETEKRTSQLRWTRQQKQIDKLDSNTVNFYAELKDIVHNLPELEEIETPMLNSGESDDTETLL
jgi:hypothetical protein